MGSRKERWSTKKFEMRQKHKGIDRQGKTEAGRSCGPATRPRAPLPRSCEPPAPALTLWSVMAPRPGATLQDASPRATPAPCPALSQPKRGPTPLTFSLSAGTATAPATTPPLSHTSPSTATPGQQGQGPNRHPHSLQPPQQHSPFTGRCHHHQPPWPRLGLLQPWPTAGAHQKEGGHCQTPTEHHLCPWAPSEPLTQSKGTTNAAIRKQQVFIHSCT